MTDILFSAFILSVVLLGIHSYFGLEIIKRGIIFTDLAIGQMAAFGAAVSILFFNGDFNYIISLGFALFAGLLNSFAAKRVKHLEAFIGLIYALGVSGVFILLSKSAHGTEELSNLLAADIIFTPQSEIVKTAILYFIIGLIIFFVNKKLSGTIREILFFTLFAVTVTSSVKLAGVFVVFTLLIAPAFISLKFAKKRNILFSWGIGILINLLAIATSFYFDFPTGYSIVFFHTLIAIISAFIPAKS
jgi:zinc/manganese transport system permease protein